MKLGATLTLSVATLMLTGAAYMHLTLVDSRPKEGATVAESPTNIWLRYNQRPDVSRSGISVRGPDGAVALGKAEQADSLSLSAKVMMALEPGEYTVSWLAAAYDDHAIRGRYKFTVEADGGPR
jgi:methionine-rich copper-binding protein CopC